MTQESLVPLVSLNREREVGLRQAVLLAVAVLLTVSAVGAEPADTAAVRSEGLKEVRSPTKAMVRSLVLPGWGQFYNGKKLKGTLVAATEVGSVVAFFVRRDQINNEVRPVGQAPKRNFFLMSSIGIVFYSVVDAFVDAHLDDFDWGQLDYRPDSRTLSLRITHSF